MTDIEGRIEALRQAMADFNDKSYPISTWANLLAMDTARHLPAVLESYARQAEALAKIEEGAPLGLDREEIREWAATIARNAREMKDG